MLSLEKMQAPASGLAQALGQPSRLSAQNSVSLDEAIRILLPHQNGSILAYLRFARSLDQNISGHGSLSKDEVGAVRALRHCDELEIRTLLGQARSTCENAGHTLDLQELTPTSKHF